MMSNGRQTVTALTLVLVLVGASVLFPMSAVGTAAAQTTNNNTTTTPNNTTTTTTQVTTGEQTSEACENPSIPQMDQSRLYAPRKTITAGEAGRIDGGFQLDNGMECPVKVSVTLRVPSGMSISGGSDWGSSGAGMVTTTFTMQPQSGIHDLSGNVYSERTGERRVTGDIEYWPVGAPEMSQEIDGLTFNFDVQEANSGPDDDDGGPITISIPNIPDSAPWIALLALAIVGMMYVAPKVGINIRK
jgi:hypothetical protein